MRRGFFHYLTEAPLLWVAITSLSAVIFIADTVTDLEVAFAVLYVAVVLLSVQSGRPGAVIAVGIMCVFLTILSFCLTRQGDFQPGLVNCGLSLLAISATTYLAIRIETVASNARRTEAQLARMSRLMIVSELGVSIAHEISQPITAITANGRASLRWLAAVPPNLQEAQQAIERVVKDADRAGEVTDRVRRLIARATPERAQVDMVETIEEALALTRNEIRHHDIILRTELAVDLPFVNGDRVQLQQVVMNFVLNAIEAMENMNAGARDLLVSAAADDKEITVSVRDCGTGVPPQTLEKIFDAFYSTKAKGMGMGLAISRSIIETHGGRVYAAPNFPRGMVFGFTLPLASNGRG